MKRLNPETGRVFKQGDVRDDGKIFFCYLATIKVNGQNAERWLSPEAFETAKTAQRNHLKKCVTQPSGRAIKMLHNAKARAEKHGGKVTISKDWICKKLEAGVCELTGLPFDLKPSDKSFRNPFSPSLDRKDNNNRDYTPENTRVVLSFINIALSDHNVEEVLPILKKLVNTLEHQK